MTNKELYIMLRRLGMVDTKSSSMPCCFIDDDEMIYPEDDFQDYVCKDTVSITNFVDDLFKNNDINRIKKFLVCMFSDNHRRRRRN